MSRVPINQNLKKLLTEVKALTGIEKSVIYSSLSTGQKLKVFSKKVIKKLAQRSKQKSSAQTSYLQPTTYSTRFRDISLEQFWEIIDPLIDESLQNNKFLENPSISIITPTYNSSLDWFVETVISVLHQSSNSWEWCLVDDGSSQENIKEVILQLNKKHPQIKAQIQPASGISAATNKALSLTEAEYVCFLDHDDTISPQAIQTSLKKLDEGFDISYSDEDKIDYSGQAYIEPFFKPDWSPEYFRGVMYVGHLLCIRKEMILQVGGFDSAYDGVQDFELLLRLSELQPKIAHIPEILYHWRKIEGSISADIKAKPRIDELQEQAVNAHLGRLELAAVAKGIGSHRLRMYPLPKEQAPSVSIIIPTKNAPHHLSRCLKSLFTLSSYSNFEVILVDNDTNDVEALNIIKNYPVKKVFLPDPFNYSRANNMGAQYARGEYLIFLNNDTEVITSDWIQHLLYYAEQPDIGAAGALLLYPDKTVQHAGVVLGFRGTADHLMRSFPQEVDGYAGSLACAREVSAVTAACLMLSKPLFELVGGFNEHYFHHYQDVDLCLKLVGQGKRNIFTPGAQLIHHESITRKSYYDLPDRYLLLDQWQDHIEKGDPYYNRNFTLERFDYSLKIG